MPAQMGTSGKPFAIPPGFSPAGTGGAADSLGAGTGDSPALRPEALTGSQPLASRVKAPGTASFLGPSWWAVRLELPTCWV